MANSFHSITIVGNLGRDPEMRYTPSGSPVTTFSVATTRAYKNAAGEKVEETVWFRVTAWGKQAENCNQFLKKGAKVGVIGRITPGENGSPRIWTKQDGTPASSFEINASEVHFLGGGNGNGAAADGGAVEEESGEEIPF